MLLIIGVVAYVIFRIAAKGLNDLDEIFRNMR
jgi:hypothetical protein